MNWRSFLNLLGRNTNRYKQIGDNCRISPKAMMLGKPNIALGSRVVIHPFASLDTIQFGTGSISIGSNSEIHPYAFLHTYGGWIDIGDDCSVNPFCVLYGHGGLQIGNMVRIAAQTIIVPADHVFADPRVPIMCQAESRQGIIIQDDVWIGAGVRILDGATIGHGSVIAAGAVVTHDVPANTVVAGVPARPIRYRSG